MAVTPQVRFSHSHHLLKVTDCQSDLDVLAFEGQEGLSKPFSYRIEFTSSDHAISREAMAKKNGYHKQILTLKFIPNAQPGGRYVKKGSLVLKR